MSENVKQKWSRISQKPKGTFIYLKVPFLRIVPLMLLLIIINYGIWGELKDISIIMLSVIKLILAYPLGVVIGNFEWNYYRDLSEGNFMKAYEIRNKYILIYGFLSFGLTILISQLDIPIKSLSLAIYYIIVWPLAGLLWGSFMWLALANGLTKYLKKENN